MTEVHDKMPLVGPQSAETAAGFAATSEIAEMASYDPTLYGDRYHLVDFADGSQRMLQVVAYFDNDEVHRPMTERIIEGRRKAYIGSWWTEEHPLDDVRGPNVEFLALVDPKNGEPLMSLRMVHAPANQLERLLCFSKFAEASAFDPEALADFMGRIAARPNFGERPGGPAIPAEGRSVVEVCCLWKSPQLKGGKALLEAEAIQRSFTRYDMWFIAMVPPEIRANERDYGKAIHRLGTTITLDEPHTTGSLRVTPMALDPLTFYDEIIMDVPSDAERYSRLFTRGIFLDGLWARDGLDGWQQKKVRELVYG